MVWVQAIRSAAVSASCSQTCVDGELAGREAAHAGLLDRFDPVLDPGVGAVPGLQERQLPASGVGGHALVAPAVVGFEHADLGAGVGPFAADQDPHPVRPAGRR